MGMAGQTDYIEAGSGETAILIHSSVAGARQWRKLMDTLSDRHHLVAINLFGYGRTPPWPEETAQTLEDQARLVEPLLPAEGRISLVGHSFGASVAMKAAALFGARVARLVLIEPNPFYLLHHAGRDASFREAKALCDTVRTSAGDDSWPEAARIFADYWTGPGSWEAMAPDRQAKFTEALKPNLHEWDGVMSETTPLSDWARLLPRDTTVIWAADTVRTIVEIVSLLQTAAPHWTYERIPRGGHMAALTQPDLVIPLVRRALN